MNFWHICRNFGIGLRKSHEFAYYFTIQKRFMATTNKLKECLNYMRRPIHSFTLQMYWITNQFHFLRVIKIMTWPDLVWSRWTSGGLDKGISNFQSSQCSGCSLPLMTMTNYAIVGKLALVSQQQNALLGSSTYPYGTKSFKCVAWEELLCWSLAPILLIKLRGSDMVLRFLLITF